ncbi:MAG: hypothetical protein IJ397_00455 [Lachnospiraceae bacterium]|nr:hypothetical protein [Lachnospiraceae bacterium]
MKKKTVIVIASVVIVLSVLLGLFLMFFLVNPYFTYINTHTWATVTTRGELQSDTAGNVELTQEYLQGESITVGEVTVIITDIGSEGTVDLKVQSGNLYDSEGNSVKKFTIHLDEQTHFTTDGGTVDFMVISNRYE